MRQIIERMQALGFSQYEAKVYLALLQQPNVTGYELAKNSGVPASKIYAILNKLISKEVVQAIDSEPKKYVPQPPDEILSRMRGDFLETVDLVAESWSNCTSVPTRETNTSGIYRDATAFCVKSWISLMTRNSPFSFRCGTRKWMRWPLV